MSESGGPGCYRRGTGDVDSRLDLRLGLWWERLRLLLLECGRMYGGITTRRVVLFFFFVQLWIGCTGGRRRRSGGIGGESTEDGFEIGGGVVGGRHVATCYIAGDLEQRRSNSEELYRKKC